MHHYKLELKYDIRHKSMKGNISDVFNSFIGSGLGLTKSTYHFYLYMIFSIPLTKKSCVKSKWNGISSVNLHQTEASKLKLINSPAATNNVKEWLTVVEKLFVELKKTTNLCKGPCWAMSKFSCLLFIGNRSAFHLSISPHPINSYHVPYKYRAMFHRHALLFPS
jgi:hypothetical protein